MISCNNDVLYILYIQMIIEHNPAQAFDLGFNSKFGSDGAREMHFCCILVYSIFSMKNYFKRILIIFNHYLSPTAFPGKKNCYCSNLFGCNQLWKQLLYKCKSYYILMYSYSTGVASETRLQYILSGGLSICRSLRNPRQYIVI